MFNTASFGSIQGGVGEDAMNRLNRKVEYALMALRYMCGKVPGELTTAKEVVEATGCPFDATARVMQLMAQKGILKSEQGSHGGYTIVRDLSKTSFYDLVEMILGPLGIVKCVHAFNNCDMEGTCNIRSPIAELNARLIDFYKDLTILEILKVKERPNQEPREILVPGIAGPVFNRNQ